MGVLLAPPITAIPAPQNPTQLYYTGDISWRTDAISSTRSDAITAITTNCNKNPVLGHDYSYLIPNGSLTLRFELSVLREKQSAPDATDCITWFSSAMDICECMLCIYE